MPRTMPCPHCAKSLNVPDNHAGNVTCPLCGKSFYPMPVATPIPTLDRIGNITIPPLSGMGPAKWVEWQGRLFWCLGFLGLAYAMVMTASVDGMYNIGLLNVRQNWVIASCFFITNGVLCQLFGLANRHHTAG